MESQPLVTISEQHSKPSEPQSRSSLLREWILKFALNADKQLDAEAVGLYEALWTDAFSDLRNSVLEAAFRKALHTCKFWPIKVADIREHLDRTRETAAAEAADLEWRRVLTIRREHFNPDFSRHLACAVAELPERVQAACQAAGVFRDFETFEQLHTWAKKRFIESYLASEMLEQNQFLLLDGQLKNLLSDLAKTKAITPLPPSVESDLECSR